MDDAKEADYAASRHLALKLAKAHGPCALVVKKPGLMEAVADAHGIRARRKEGVLDGQCECCASWDIATAVSWRMPGSLPRSRNTSGPMWDGADLPLVRMGGCRPTQGVGGSTPIAPEMLVAPGLLGSIIEMMCCFG